MRLLVTPPVARRRAIDTHRLALLVTVALPAFLGAQAAPAAPRITPVRGAVRALAFGGDALVVACQRPSAGSSSNASSRPRRRARSCARDSPTTTTKVSAVHGSQIAWSEDCCGEPPQRPPGVAPSVIAVGGADPAVPPRRSPVTGQGPLSALALVPGDAGLAALLLPSFFALDSAVRPFGPTGIGAPIVAEQCRAVSPVGILGDGTRVFVLASVEDETGCDTEVFTIAPGSDGRRPISTGSCSAG